MILDDINKDDRIAITIGVFHDTDIPMDVRKLWCYLLTNSFNSAFHPFFLHINNTSWSNFTSNWTGIENY